MLTNAKHKKLATLTLKGEPTNKALTLSEKLTRTLAKGRYSISVKATDVAANTRISPRRAWVLLGAVALALLFSCALATTRAAAAIPIATW